MDTLIGFDFGLKRIGVAVGNSLVKIAKPLSIIHANKNNLKFQCIEKLVNEWDPNKAIVGVPYKVNGTSSDMTIRCKRFANQLNGRFGLEVILVDERFSSVVIERKYGYKIDSDSAVLILQQYFDTNELSST